MVDDGRRLQVGSFGVHRLGFGTMQLTGPGAWGPPADRAGAVAVLRRAVDLGVQLIDTADSYGPDVAEEIVKEALHPYPSALKIATKAGFQRPGPDQWVECGRPEHLRHQCESSLRRLGVEQIDLFQLHRLDPRVAEDEQFGALRELRDEGKVREVGLSEVTVAQIQAARPVVPVVSVQNQYNIAQRGDDGVVDFCQEEGIAFFPWFPLGNGKLTRRDGPLDQVAAELGATIPQVCLAWLLRRAPVMLPIPGTASLEHLEENCRAAALTLTDSQFDSLTESRKAVRRWALSG
ncbi:MAG: aldo/keto reductase [Acidimicrobiales bacterium]